MVSDDLVEVRLERHHAEVLAVLDGYGAVNPRASDDTVLLIDLTDPEDDPHTVELDLAEELYDVLGLDITVRVTD